MRSQQAEFTEFFQTSWEPCLRAVVAVTCARQPAEDQVAEAFARAWASWRKVRQHPAPQAWVVRTALNTGASWWRRRNRELPLADHDLTAPAGIDGGPGSSPGHGRAATPAAAWTAPCSPRYDACLNGSVRSSPCGSSLTSTPQPCPGSWAIEAGTVRMHLSRAIAALRRELTPITKSTEADR